MQRARAGWLMALAGALCLWGCSLIVDPDTEALPDEGSGAGSGAADPDSGPGEPPETRVKAYGLCQTSAGCEGEADCIKESSGTNGFCAPPCGDGQSCPPSLSSAAPAVCIDGSCSLECGPAAQCPAGMSCGFPLDSVCRWPQ